MSGSFEHGCWRVHWLVLSLPFINNMLNSFDHGRYIQQSYYGDNDVSDWNGKPWCYNPVQGEVGKVNPLSCLKSQVDEYRVYAKTQPRQWASEEDVSDMLKDSG